MRNHPIRLIALISITGLVACASPAIDGQSASSNAEESPKEFEWRQVVPVTGPTAQTTSDGLVRVRAPDSKGFVFMNLDEMGLHRFDRVVLGNVWISYASGGQIWGDRKEGLLRDYLRQTIQNELISREHWQIAEGPGEGVLLARVAVTNADVRLRKGFTTGPNTVILAAGGDVILTLDLMDSDGLRPIVRIIENRKLRPGTYPGHYTDFDRLKHVFRDFSRSAGLSLHGLYRPHQPSREFEAPPN